MTDKKHSIVHGTFTLERTYPVAPAKVWAAFAKAENKKKWFGGDEWTQLKDEFDFRVGGREISIGKHKNGVVSAFECRYYDIIENIRMVYAYEMHLDDKKISVSLATIELEQVGTSTKLTMHEDGAYLDGYDDAGSRRGGTEWLLGKLGEVVVKL
ncbi:MAG: SRPBCC family protein [Kofleriaceae bacterium]